MLIRWGRLVSYVNVFDGSCQKVRESFLKLNQRSFQSKVKKTEEAETAESSLLEN